MTLSDIAAWLLTHLSVFRRPRRPVVPLPEDVDGAGVEQVRVGRPGVLHCPDRPAVLHAVPQGLQPILDQDGGGASVGALDGVHAGAARGARHQGPGQVHRRHVNIDF